MSQIAVASLAFAAASVFVVQAQEPAPVLGIVREDMKPGKGMAHEKTEAAFVRAFSKSKFPHYIGMVNVTGPSHALFLERYDSFEAVGDEMALTDKEPLKSEMAQADAADGELRTGERYMLATYRKELSYEPVPAELAKYRFYSINTLRVRPGHGDDFEGAIKMLNTVRQREDSKRRYVVYGVVSGAPAGTYLMISGMESLKAMDPPRPAKTGAEAFGAEDWVRYEKLVSDIVISNEGVLYAVSPKMSYPPKEFIEADPAFWAPKPAMAKPAAKAAAKPDAAK
jgi:hypothetical protein